MPTYSLLGPMSDRPYALGERPGGSDIPSIPLLTGRNAWNSISGRYDGRHMDTRLRPDVDHTIAPRPTDSLRDKKAAAEKMARGGGILRMLKRLIPQSPTPIPRYPVPLPPELGITSLLMRQRTPVRGRPYRSTAAGASATSSGKPLLSDMAKMRLALWTPPAVATGGVAAAGGYQAHQGLKDYLGKRRAAAQPAASTAPAAVTTDAGPPPPPQGDSTATPDALAKAKDFFQTHGTQLGVGAVSGVGLYALYKILQNLTTNKEEKRQRAFEMLPKAAEADPGRFCEEFPRLAGFLCYCHNMDLDDPQIAAGIEKAGNTIHEFDIELVKLAGGAWDWTKKNLIPTAGDVGALAKQELGGAARTVKGLGHVAAGGIGAVGSAQLGLGQGLYNQTLGRIPGFPQAPARESFDVARQAAGQMRAGLKDVIGARASTLKPPGQDAKYLPPVLNEWARGPASGQTYATRNLDRIRSQPGVGDVTRRLSQFSEGVGDTAATSLPFVATGGTAGLGWPAYAADIAAGEGPWAEASKAIGMQEAESGRAQARAAMPQTLADFSPEQQQLHELRRRRIVEEIQRDPSLSEGQKARAIEDASTQVVEEMGRAQEGLLPFQDLEPPDAGPPAGQNPNIPGAPDTAAEPTDSLQGLDPNKLNNLPPEQAQGARQAADQAAAALQQDPKATEAAANEILSSDPNTPADQQGQGSLAKQLGDPQTAMEMYQQMDPGAKLLLWGGLAIGAIGLLSALADERGGGLMSWIMVLLGVGGALGAAGHGGFLGQGAQQGIQGLMGQITGKQQPPPAPSADSQAATQMASQQIASAESPAAGLEVLLEDGLTGEESRELFDNPATRQHMLSLSDKDRLAMVNAAAKNPEFAEKMLSLANLNPDQAMKVLTGPSGQQVDMGFMARLFGKQPTGMGLSPQEAEVMYTTAQRYAAQGQGQQG